MLNPQTPLQFLIILLHRIQIDLQISRLLQIPHRSLTQSLPQTLLSRIRQHFRTRPRCPAPQSLQIQPSTQIRLQFSQIKQLISL